MNWIWCLQDAGTRFNFYDSEYVEVDKNIVEDRSRTWVRMIEQGQQVFQDYREQVKDELHDLPD